MSAFQLPNGAGAIPAIGLGTFLSERREVGNAVSTLAPFMREMLSIPDAKQPAINCGTLAMLLDLYSHRFY